MRQQVAKVPRYSPRNTRIAGVVMLVVAGLMLGLGDPSAVVEGPRGPDLPLWVFVLIFAVLGVTAVVYGLMVPADKGAGAGERRDL